MRATGLVACVFAAAMTVSGASFGQTVGGFALNRFDPSERGSDWFSTDSLDLRGNHRFAIGAVGEWAHKPLVFYDASGDELEDRVKDQVFVHVGASWVLRNRLRIALNVPIAVYNDGTDLANRGKNGAGIGDVRVSTDFRLLGKYEEVFTLALGVEMFVPTGNKDAYTGDERMRFVPRVQFAGDVGIFAYSGRLGWNIRTQTDSFDNNPFGSELLFGAAAGLKLADRRLVLGPEIYGSTNSGDGIFKKKTTPFEVIFGGRYKFASGWRVGLGAGPGLTRAYGTPQFRVLGSVEWFPEFEEAKEPLDSDGDGIYDADDACPNEPGQPNSDPKKHGCPVPPDTDGDGILDADDACPDEPGVASEDPSKHGCPLPPPPSDRDGDGILDDDDACPDEAGVASEDPALNGCPLRDTDGDGILDRDDACPNEVGEPNEDPAKNGCPKVIVTKTEIKIMERIEFDTNKATIRPESASVLNAVLEILQQHPEIKKVDVQGHTDNKGVPYLNLTLSKQRAAAVVKWLTDRGIAKDRLTSQGLGQTKPIDTNDTDQGRQNNRRVEFQITERASE